MKHLRLVLAAIASIWQVALIGTSVCAQNPPSQAPTEDVATIRAQTRLVLVDAVVTDKKGNYLSDLTAKDFRVWEDNKEQTIKNFSLESGATNPNRSEKHYLVLFFDNSTLSADDQVRARKAAAKFIETNASPDHLIAVIDFGGSIHISQNFTSDVARLQKAVSGIKNASVSPNDDSSIQLASLGMPNLSNAAADFGVHTVMLALRNVAKGLSSVPGRKTLVFLTTGFPLNAERQSELTTVIDVCNKANVSVYPIDARGLVGPFGSLNQFNGRKHSGEHVGMQAAAFPSSKQSPSGKAHLIYTAWQHGGGGGGHGPGGGGGTGGGGHGPGGGGGTGGGGGKVGGGGGKTGGGGGTRVGSSSVPFYNRAPVQPPRLIVPQFPDLGANDQLLYALAEGTGGFVIHNSNDLLAGLKKIAKDQDQYYVLSYTPPESPEGSCHTLKVKVDRGGTEIRSRSGYCNVKPVDLLAGKPQEKDLEGRVSGTQAGDITASVQAPYFYVSPNTARVNLAMEIPTGSIKFGKQKGAQHAEINVLGVAYKPDGSVAGRFSDTVNLDFDSKKEVEDFAKNPLHYENQFELASGHYTLKVAFNGGEQNFGRVEIPLVIDPYEEKQFSISGLALSKEIRRISDLATGIDAELLADRTPLVVRGMQIIPTGANRFKNNEPAEIYLEVYDPLLLGEKPPKVLLQYSVLNLKSGERKLDVSITNTESSVIAGSRVVPLGLKLPVDSLPPGAYRVEIRALDLAGNSSPTRTAEFQVE